MTRGNVLTTDSIFDKFFSDGAKINIFHVAMKNLTKIFCHFKNTRYICTDLTMDRSIKALFLAVFFIFAYQNSLGCCFSSGSRYLALLTCPKSEKQQFFIFKSFFKQTNGQVN